MPTIQSVKLKKIVEEFQLEVFVEGADYEKCKIVKATINRPGLSLVGFYDFFDNDRVQLMGKMEHTYLKMMGREDRLKCFRDLFSHPVPALLLARGLHPFPECVQAAREYGRTILGSSKKTGELMSDLTTSLRSYLAPRFTRHGVLVEVYGEGILLMGESGIGKSEVAVELVKRGHRLIADDAVELKRISPTVLMGNAPKLLRYYVEMRGIGVVDVRQLFGMSAVKDEQQVDMVVHLEPWEQGVLYDRLGLDDNYEDMLGVVLPSLTIPVKQGRNLAVIIEVAAMNNRHKKMGYNAAKEFTNAINAHFDAQMAAAEEA